MIKELERAIEKLKQLSPERQEYAAAVLEQFAEETDEEFYELTEHEERLLQVGLEQANRGEFATEEEVRKAFDSYRK